jgi:hypothetical protein
MNKAVNTPPIMALRLGIFYWGYSTTTTYYAIANQSPLYDAVFSQIEYPLCNRHWGRTTHIPHQNPLICEISRQPLHIKKNTLNAATTTGRPPEKGPK